MNKISNDIEFESYVGKYIDVNVNGDIKKYYVSYINAGNIVPNAGILFKPYNVLQISPFQKCADQNDINWAVTYDGTLNGNPWTVSTSGRFVRFSIENSVECGGTNINIQSGTAVASISVGKYPIYMNLNFIGNVEQQNTGFENMSFYLNENYLASATSVEAGLECIMGPPISTFIVNPPYLLSAYSINEFLITFTTGDGRWHFNAFYEINLDFYYDSAMTLPISSF
jgi:hypothetical protein